jgi:hypothetical protein
MCFAVFPNYISFSSVVDEDGFRICERFSRLPLKMDVPEKILCQAHAQPGPVADFLHENGISFQHTMQDLYEKLVI